MRLTPPGTPTLTPHAAFHGPSLSLGVIDDPGSVVVGGGRSIGWGSAMDGMVPHLDAIGIEFGAKEGWNVG